MGTFRGKCGTDQLLYEVNQFVLCSYHIQFAVLCEIAVDCWECFTLQNTSMDSHLLDMVEINEGMFKVHIENN